MGKKIEFLFDVGSPTTYLAWTQLPKIAKEHDAEIVWVPVLLGGIFKASGNAPPALVPAKGQHFGHDLARFAARYGVPLAINPWFPINTLSLMRTTTALAGSDDFHPWLEKVWDAMWIHPRNLNEPEELAKLWQDAGFDPEKMKERIAQPEVKEKLMAETQKAVERGAFGAPTFFIGDEMFFGQDRLDFIAEELAK